MSYIFLHIAKTFQFHQQVESKKYFKMISKFLIFVIFSIILKSFPVHSITCQFEIDARDNSYGCKIIDQVIKNENDMAVITGNHLSGYVDESVTTLHGVNSTIEIFPSTVINKFVNLNSVWMTNVMMRMFTNAILTCPKLESVTLNFNEISSIPGDIFTRCENLLFFSAVTNRIENIHNNAFSGLGKLETLKLMQNKISTLTPEMFAPTYNLKNLNLDWNYIDNFSMDIFKALPQLSELHLKHNKFTSWITTELVSSLTVLHLAENQISKIEPNSFSSFNNLKVLSVGNLLESFPSIVTNTANLKELYLDFNKFKTITFEPFRALTELQQLHMSNNLLESVNFSLAGSNILSKLQILFLRENFIEEISDDAFTGLNSLTHLDLTANKLKKLNNIKPSIGLAVLDVTNNKIESINRELFTNVTKMTFRAKENVCTNADFIIDQDFDIKVAPLLEECLNFGVVTQSNAFVLVAAVWLTFVAKMF